MQSKKRVIAIGCLFILLTVLGACGTVQHQQTIKARLGADKPFIISNIEVDDVSGFKFPAGEDSIDLKQTLYSALEQRLKNEQLLTDAQGEDFLILDAKIVEYAPGHAGKRWLFPGYGSTILSTYCELKEKKTGILISEIQARRTIEAGGLYTIGAWKTIFNSVADDIVEEIKKAKSECR